MPKAPVTYLHSTAEQKAIPDRLAELREKISALKAEAEVLRDILVDDPSSRIGADYVATVRTSVQRRVSSKELRESEPEIYARLAREHETVVVLLKRRAGD